MSGFIPTTQVMLLERSEGTDEYGDPVDEYRRGKKAVPAHIAENKAEVPDPSTGTLTIVTNHTALLPGHLQVTRGQRLVDLKTDITYVVERIRRRNTFVGQSPVRAELQLVE